MAFDLQSFMKQLQDDPELAARVYGATLGSQDQPETEDEPKQAVGDPVGVLPTPVRSPLGPVGIGPDKEDPFGVAVEKALQAARSSGAVSASEKEMEAEPAPQPNVGEWKGEGDWDKPAKFPAAPATLASPDAAEDGPDINLLFRTAHGTDFDPNSRVDKATLDVIKAMLEDDPKLAKLSPTKFALQLYRKK